MTSTAPQDVLWPKDAPYNADIKDIQRRLPVDIARFLSAESIEEVAEIDEDILRYWVRYRSRPESRQFFAKVRPWMIHLCMGRPEIPTPPLESDPVAWTKWFADLKAAILGQRSGMAGRGGKGVKGKKSSSAGEKPRARARKHSDAKCRKALRQFEDIYAKRMLNGPCGGSREDRCEVRPDRPCAWQLIYTRLKEIGQMGRPRPSAPPKNWSHSIDGGQRLIVRQDHRI